MAIQTVNLGTAPSGAGGDTFRSTGVKINENFTNPVHAASRQVGLAQGDVMEVGAFGFGGDSCAIITPTSDLDFIQKIYGRSQIARRSGGTGIFATDYAAGIYVQAKDTYLYFNAHFAGGDINILAGLGNTAQPYGYTLKTSRNTTVDGSGFLKNASPVVKLFADHIELNDDAEKQPITFEKLDVGDYLIKGSLGFAQESWYIEVPKDANGNVLVAVVYEQLENNDISVKTYKKKFDAESASVVADIDKPIDITTGRWIDLRLQELPQPEIKIPESATPPDFQPTGLAQAVAAVMESYNDPKQ